MVADSTTTAIIALTTAAAGGFGLAALWIWRHVENNLNGADDRDKIEELEDDRWSSVSSELATLHQSIEEYVDQNDSPEELTQDEHIVNVIEQEVNPGELETVVKELRKVGNIESLYEDYVNSYEETYVNCAKVSASIFVLGSIPFVSDLFSQDPTKGIVPFVIAFMGVYFVLCLQRAVSSFNNARSCKSEFDKRWKDYRTTTPDLDF
ncbi:hypothetical protein ACFQE1_03380 [Halobium palmae]|uniref:Uncharacterized protein n=1 Tax=Halobium palmae TaxID=1776492 RepID=A0ABD5RWA6_9EURY